MSWKLATQLVACRTTFLHDEKRRHNTTTTYHLHAHEIRQHLNLFSSTCLRYLFETIKLAWGFKTVWNSRRCLASSSDIKRHLFEMHRFVLRATPVDRKWATKGKSQKWHGTDIIKPYRHVHGFKLRQINKWLLCYMFFFDMFIGICMYNYMIVACKDSALYKSMLRLLQSKCIFSSAFERSNFNICM